MEAVDVVIGAVVVTGKQGVLVDVVGAAVAQVSIVMKGPTHPAAAVAVGGTNRLHVNLASTVHGAVSDRVAGPEPSRLV